MSEADFAKAEERWDGDDDAENPENNDSHDGVLDGNILLVVERESEVEESIQGEKSHDVEAEDREYDKDDASLTDMAPLDIIGAKDELSSKSRDDVDWNVSGTEKKLVQSQIEQQYVSWLAIQLLPQHANDDEEI